VTIGVKDFVVGDSNSAVGLSVGPEDRSGSVNVTRETSSFFFNRDHVYTLNYSILNARLNAVKNL